MSAAERKKLQKLQEKQRERELREIFGAVEKREEEKPVKNEEDQTAEDVMNDVNNELEEEREMTLEDIIEKERAKILGGTPVTPESFAKWKAFKQSQKDKEEEVAKKLREKAFKKGGTSGLSGKALFEMDANAFVDEEGAVDKDAYAIDEDLFLDSDDEGDDEEDVEELDEWDPAAWKETDPPKQKLQEFITKDLKLKNKDYPQYQETKIASGGFLFKIHLPHIDKTLEPLSAHKSKKNAQNAAAYMAWKYLQKQMEESK